MKNRLRVGPLTLLALTLAAGVSGKPERAGKPETLWLRDYTQARDAARRLNRPLFVVFRCEH